MALEHLHASVINECDVTDQSSTPNSAATTESPDKKISLYLKAEIITSLSPCI
jgi:hypothetical protein